jgi:putative transposase
MMETHYIQFFTATILWWKPLLQEDRYKDIVLQSMKFLVDDNRARIHGFVIMPNHLHIIWRINKERARADVQRDFLKYTAQQIKFDLLANNPGKLREFEVNAKDRQYQFWERNALSIDLYSEKVLLQKLDYIHRNPIQKGWKLSDDELGYKYSSCRFYNGQGDDFGFLSHYLD